jgi:hypothetical protein
MFIELVDTLRCPRAHEESWLVASARHMDARHIVSGTLGCPVCLTEYPIEAGVVDFRAVATEVSSRGTAPPTDDAMRLAAMLDLSDSTGFAVLLGTWGSLAHALTSVVEPPVILVDPPGDIAGAPGISVIRCDGEIPLATGAARAIAIDEGSTSRAASAVRLARTKGRLVAPVTLSLPTGVRELARDERLWVAEREAIASPIVTLHVRRAHT